MQTKALRFIATLFLVCLLTLPALASTRGRGALFAAHTTVVVRPHPYWGYGWGWGWYDPFWGPYSAPYYYNDNRGSIKIKDPNKLDQVYLDGAYAGTVEKMKSIKLEPGRYNVEIRSEGKSLFGREVYVISGKTVEIRVN